MHPLLVSCIFHFEFEFCHPFLTEWVDGIALADSALSRSGVRGCLSAIRRRQADYRGLGAFWCDRL